MMRMLSGLRTPGMVAVDEERCRGRGSVDGERRQTAVATGGEICGEKSGLWACGGWEKG
jgi:hypothetical protein